MKHDGLARGMLSDVGDDVRAEMCLRLMVERALLDGSGHHPFGGPIVSAAEALNAVGAVEKGLAGQILDDYGLACQLRGRGGRAAFTRAVPASPVRAATRLESGRVVTTEADVDLSGWRVKVRYVLLCDDRTVLGIAATQSQPGGPVLTGHPFRTQLSDDRGRTSACSFSGGGGPNEVEGVLTADAPLTPDTRWIALGGQRVDLPESASEPPRASIERLPVSNPALAHLWNRLASSRQPTAFTEEDLAAAIEALVHVDALDPASPQIAQLRLVCQTLSQHPHIRHPHSRSHPAGPGAAWATGLPEPWSSLAATISRRPLRGPTGVLAVGAVTPPIDGVTVVLVEALISSTDSFHIRVAASPAISVHPTAALDDPSIAWWAEDNHGGVYLGQIGNWATSPELSQGTVQFWPALDPQCRQLRVMPTGKRERAVIPVALDWKHR